LRFVPVSAEELARLRADVHAGAPLETTPATFALAEVAALNAEHQQEIDTFRTRREAAFTAERERWAQ
jgi:urea carboxylase